MLRKGGKNIIKLWQKDFGVGIYPHHQKNFGVGIYPIILSAGQSSRLGIHKALCEFGKPPHQKFGGGGKQKSLSIILETCAKAKLSTPIVVLGHQAETIKKTVDLTKAIVVHNLHHKHGQTSSLKAGLRALPPDTQAFLIYPVDFPLVTHKEIGLLVKAFKKNRDTDKKIFIPSYNRRCGHPVLFDISIKDEFLSLSDKEPAHNVVNANPHTKIFGVGAKPERITYVNVKSPYVLMDIDTKEDYERCLKIYGQRL